MNEVFIVNDFAGIQKGTKDSPYSVRTAAEYDGLFASLLREESGAYRRQLLINLGAGEFLTNGCYEWGELATADRPRLGFDWQIIGTGPDTTLSLDPLSFPDEWINDWPLHVICSASQWQEYLWYGRDAEWAALSPESLWSTLPKRQLIRDLTLNLNYSKFIDRWIGKDKALKLSGGVLQGHGAAFENVVVRDFGAHKLVGPDGNRIGDSAESFPLIITGAADGFDRNKLSKLDPTKYIVDNDLADKDCAHHTGCSFSDYSDADSNDQVSLCLIAGIIGQPTVGDFSAGDATSPYKTLYRRYAYQTHNSIGDFPNSSASTNQVQAFTQYQVLKGDCSFNTVSNVQAGYYGDFFRTFNVDVHDNEFTRVLRGVAFLLSPTGPDCDHFVADGHKVRRNKISQIGSLADWHAGVLLWNFENHSPDRYIGRITIGGKGEENEFSIDGPIGPLNIAIRVNSCDSVTIGENKYMGYNKGQEVLVTDSTNTKLFKGPSFWRKIWNFLKHLVGR